MSLPSRPEFTRGRSILEEGHCIKIGRRRLESTQQTAEALVVIPMDVADRTPNLGLAGQSARVGPRDVRRRPAVHHRLVSKKRPHIPPWAGRHIRGDVRIHGDLSQPRAGCLQRGQMFAKVERSRNARLQGLIAPDPRPAAALLDQRNRVLVYGNGPGEGMAGTGYAVAPQVAATRM